MQSVRNLLYCVCVLYTCIAFCGGVDIADLTESDFHDKIKENKCIVLYVVQDNCETCQLLYHKFIIAAQNFRKNQTVMFGRVRDPKLHLAFGVKKFPGIAYYEFGSAVPKIYHGDITSGALVRVIAGLLKRDQKTMELQFAIELTKDNYHEIMNTDKQYRLIMLHEDDDTDTVKEYEELAKTYDNEIDIVIARINVQFEKRLKLEFRAVEYPSFYWFTKGIARKKKRYGGEFNVDQMIGFINNEAKLFRTKDGRLNSYAGLIRSLDDILIKHSKDLYEIRNLDSVRKKMKKEIARLSSDADRDLAEFYIELVNEIEEDRSTVVLDEMRNRLFRQMNFAGPHEFDNLIMKKNIVQKIMDIIGNHLLQKMTDVDIGLPLDEDTQYGFTADREIVFHEEL